MVTYITKYGRIASPVFYLASIEITNLQDVPSAIYAYSIAVSDTEAGPWESLLPISLLKSDLYHLGISGEESRHTLAFPRGAYRLATEEKPEAMTHAALMAPSPKLEAELGKLIQPYDPIHGWAAFDLANRTDRRIRNYFRITVRDHAQRSWTSITILPRRRERDPEAHFDPLSLIHRVGPISDISFLEVRYYGDVYPKP